MSWRDHDLSDLASSAEMEGGDFAADLPDPYDVFGVAREDVPVPRWVPSRAPLMCGHEDCDFSTFDSDEWELHAMDSNHALFGADE